MKFELPEQLNLPLHADDAEVFDQIGLLVAEAYSEEIAQFLAAAVNEAQKLRAEIAELRAKLDDDWISVSSGRVPEDGQRIWVTKTTGDVIEYTFDRLQFWESSEIAWKPVYKPEPYKPEVAND